MAMKIDADACAACGTCEDECPNGAISSKGGNFTINAKKCTECDDLGKPRCASACPSDCISKA